MQPSDGELLAAWRSGDREAGTALFRRYFRQIRRFFCNKVSESDVEDLLQRTFAGVVEGRERFRDDASFRTYLFAIARRQLYRYLGDRSQRERRFAGELRTSSIVALGLTPGTVLDAQAEQRRVLLALQRIALPFQEILELHYWEGMLAREIAAILEIEPTTARTRLHRARKALMDVLAEHEPNAPAAADVLDSVARSIAQRL
jgi:RNA polymerase sigma factor (sigma-70 family)